MMRDDGPFAQTDPTNMNAAENAAELATVAASSFRLWVSKQRGAWRLSGGAAVACGGSALLNVQLSPLLLPCCSPGSRNDHRSRRRPLPRHHITHHQRHHRAPTPLTSPRTQPATHIGM